MTDVSILIPHKPGPSNDKVLRLAIDSIMRFSTPNCELIIDTTTPKDPYVLWNEMAAQSRGKVLVFSNSDVIFAPDWEFLMVSYATTPNRIVTGYIVEPGNIGVAPVNLRANYGKHPDEFGEAGFHSYVSKRKDPDAKIQRAWYMPCAMNREWFLSTGGFPTDAPFPNPNDIIFWDRCRDELGTEFWRVKSYSYHFQNQSGRD